MICIFLLAILGSIVFPIAMMATNPWENPNTARGFRYLYVFMFGMAFFNVSVLFLPKTFEIIQDSITRLILAAIPFTFLILPPLNVNDLEESAKSKIIDQKIGELQKEKIVINVDTENKRICGVFWDYGRNGLVLRTDETALVLIPWDIINLIEVRDNLSS